MSSQTFKLSPSDFAFLWEECKRCFYLKVVRGFDRPRSTMPKIFMTIDSQMKKHFAGKRSEQILPGMPPGTVQLGETWVQSASILLAGHTAACYLRGKFDTVMRFDDGSFGVIDFKTSERKPEHLGIYSRQLHAYAYALENPAEGRFSLKPITRLGLLVYEPRIFADIPPDRLALEGNLGWVEMPLDYAAFTRFLSEVMDVLEQPEPPESGRDCPFCAYRDQAQEIGA